MDAGNLNCPMCGVSVSSASPKCLHCGTRLATVACPSCFAMMFEGSRFCPHCGVKRDRTVSRKTALPCPKCKSKQLANVCLGHTQVSECEGCHGLWVNASTFETICTDREKQTMVLGSPATAYNPASRPFEKNVRYVRCPECEQLMHRVNFAKCSGIIVDVCKAHGTWFDRDELQHIVEFIRTGGLDLARTKEKAELEAARRRLEAARTARTPWEGSHERAGTWTFGEPELFDIAGSVMDYLIGH